MFDVTYILDQQEITAFYDSFPDYLECMEWLESVGAEILSGGITQ